MNAHKSFVGLALVSLLVSIASLIVSNNVSELQSFLTIIATSLAILLLLLLVTSKYWAGARGVSR